MLSNKKLMLFSGMIAIFLLCLNYIGTYQLCGGREYGGCMDMLAGLIILLSPSLPLFGLSLLMYFMRTEIYMAWFKFVRIWIPLSILAIFIAPEYSHDWMYRVEKGSVALGMSALFVLVSLAIIAYGYLRPRRS